MPKLTSKSDSKSVQIVSKSSLLNWPLSIFSIMICVWFVAAMFETSLAGLKGRQQTVNKYYDGGK